MKKILICAAFIYFFLAPITYQPDNKLVLYWSGINQGSVWDIWSYGAEHFQGSSQYNYPPVHFYIDKLQYFMAKAVAGPGFDDWLSSQNNLDAYQPQLSRFSLAMKIPLILSSLLVGWLLYKIALQKKLTQNQSLWVAILWFFNPITLYSIPIMGQNDVLAILFFLAGWYTFSQHFKSSMLFFGAAASIKLYPFLWLFLLVCTEKSLSIQKRVYLFLGSIGVFVLTLLPFILNPVFRSAVLDSSINKRFTMSGIDIGFSDIVYVIPLLLLVLLYAIKKVYHTVSSFQLQLISCMTATLILLGFSHFHVQWYTWVVPFWALWIGSTESRTALIERLFLSLLTFFAWAGVLILFADTALTTGIFLSLGSHLTNAPILRDMLMQVKIDAMHLNNLAHTFLAGISCLALLHLFQMKKNDTPSLFKSNPLPTLSINNNYKIKTKLAIMLSVMTALTLVVFVIIFAIQCIPLPRSSPPPQNVLFLTQPFPYSETFTAIEDRLYYFELNLKNSGLADKNDYTITVFDYEKNQVMTQKFNGYNIGDPGKIRFNVPVFAASKNKEFTFVITPVAENQQTSDALAVGIDQVSQKAAVQSFYKPSKNYFQILEESLQQFTHIVYTNWFLYILLIGLLLLL